MKTSPIAAFAAASILGLITSPALAQQRAAGPPPQSRTAIVDMATIMKGSNRFNAAMERLKAEFEAKGEELKKEGERGNQLQEELRGMTENTPQRKELEQRILKLRADYDINGKRVTEDIRDSESRIVLGLTQEVGAELERYGKATGTPLIIRANPVPPNLNDPRIILQEIHKPIVYQQDSTNVTAIIVDALNRGTVPNTAAATPPGRGAPPAWGAALPQRPVGR